MKTNRKSLKSAMMILTGVALFFGLAGSAFCAETYKFERMWPTLQQPWYFINQTLAVNPYGYIYISCGDDNHICKFSPDGFLITTWGVSGIMNGQFFSPSALATDTRGYVYAVDPYNYHIQVFDPNGNFIRKWGDFGYENGQFGDPYGIAVSESGYVYVTDIGNNCIHKFTMEGKFVARWGKIDDYGHPKSGSEDGQFNMPIDVAVDENENVYVADTGNNRIQKFDSDGKFLMKINCYHKNFLGENVPESPYGITVDEKGYIYTSITFGIDNPYMKYYSPDGKLIAEFGTRGSGYGQFCPGKVVRDNKGYLYIKDSVNNRVQKFDKNRNFISTWGSDGSDIGQFNKPIGITTDGNGYVYVVDSYNNRIQKFDQNGNFITTWGTYDHTDGNFDLPLSIAIDKSGDIYVRDAGIHVRDDGTLIARIQKFDPKGNFILAWEPDSRISSWIAFGSNGYLYVVGEDNKTIYVFTSDGILKKQWNAGSDEQYGYNPSGRIAVDSNGNIYVYTFNSAYWRIQQYDSDGKLIKTLINPETGDLQFFSDGPIACDSSGNCFFAARTKNVFPYIISIYKFDFEGNFITKFGDYGTGPGSFYGMIESLCVGTAGKIYASGQNRIQIFKPVQYSDNSKAIVVSAGGPFPGNDIWDATQMSANFAYRALTYQGFTKETIYYLSSNTQLDLDDNGIADDVDGDVTKANLEYAITQWAKDADSVVIYLVDHGGNGIFRLSESQTLSASDLKTWLDTLQSTMPGRVIVVYDACESGSFVSALTPPSGKSRMVITSTSPNEPARFLTQGSVSFSNFFWTHIFNGVNVGDAFDLAVKSLASANLQTPMADANGNGIANESEDFTIAKTVYIGNGTKISGNAPVIGSVSPDQTVNNTSSATLTAYNVTDEDGIARVWAVIRPPDYNIGNSGNPVNELPSVDLMPKGNDLFEAVYDKFNTAGTYRIAIYARDRIGNTAIPKLTTVSVTNPLRRRAIIVAGGSQSDPIWTGVQNNALLAYESLKFQGYSDDDIYFMSPVTFSSGVDGSPSQSNLKYAVETWAAVSTQDMVLYMIGNGNVGIFNISPTETLSAIALNNSLEILQGKISGKVTVIYDAANSGSFIKSLVSPSGKQRILFSSTGENQTAHFDSDGDISFSKYFWKRVLNGANLRDAFEHARNALNVSRLNQTPYLDDNGNGIGNELGYDGRVARDYKIGFGIMLAGDDPIIGDISPEQTLTGNTSATIWAKVTTTGTIDRVWAMMIPGGNIVNLVYNSVSGRYEKTLTVSGFGRYDVVIYAEDKQGNISMPKATVIRKEADPIPGDLNADGKVDLTDAIIALRALAGIDASSMIRSNYPISGADVNGDGKIGLQEEIYILQKVAGLR